MIEYWIQHPFQIEGFKPLTRDEIYSNLRISRSRAGSDIDGFLIDAVL